MSVVLRFEGVIPNVLTDTTKLKLEGKGSYNVSGSGSVYKAKEDLQGEGSFDNQSKYALTIFKQSKKNRLGEAGWEVGSSFGQKIDCNKFLFEVNRYESGGGVQESDYQDVGLKNVQFSLEGCANPENKYGGKQGCLIKIDDSEGKGLKWAEGFKPIVVR